MSLYVLSWHQFLDNAHIAANAFEGDGGNIAIQTTGLYEFSHNVIEASSQYGLDGEVDIQSPDINVAGSLLVLPSQFLDIGHMLKALCGYQPAADRFALVNAYGSIAVPEDWQNSHLPKTLEKTLTGFLPSEPKPTVSPTLVGCRRTQTG